MRKKEGRGRDIKWIKERKKNWREYREKLDLTEIEEDELKKVLLLQIPERKPKKENEKVEYVKELVVEDKETESIEVRELENEKDEIEPSGIQALVLMGWGRDWLPEGPIPGVKLVSRR